MAPRARSITSPLHEIMPTLPDPILQPFSFTGKHAAFHKYLASPHLHGHDMSGNGSNSLKNSPITTLLSLLTAPTPSLSRQRHRNHDGRIIGDPSSIQLQLDQSVDWQSVVRKLHESIADEEFINSLSGGGGGHSQIPIPTPTPIRQEKQEKADNILVMDDDDDHDLDGGGGGEEEDDEEGYRSRRTRKLLMTGERVIPRPHESRPVTHKVTSPSRPPYVRIFLLLSISLRPSNSSQSLLAPFPHS